MPALGSAGAASRMFSLVMAGLMFLSHSLSGLHALGTEIGDAIEQLARKPHGHFTDSPRPAFRGSQPGRAGRTRGGLWSQQNLSDMANSHRRLYAWIVPEGQEPQHSTPVSPEPGGAFPWEGSHGGTNTANGNKLTTLPLFSWTARGGMTVDFTLYHNSQTSYNDELGRGWTWTYDIYINESGSTATVHWGDGRCVPFTAPGGGGGTTGETGGGSGGGDGMPTRGPSAWSSYTPVEYISPDGIFDKLVKNTDGTWPLTKKDQRVFSFNTSGFCHEIEDRNGNTITITLTGGNYATAVTDPSGRQYTISLQSGSRFTSDTDPNGNTWSFDIDGSDDLVEVEWPELGGNTYTDEFVYNGAGRLTSLTNPHGETTSWTYNGAGRVTRQDFHSGAYATYAYDSRGRPTQIRHRKNAGSNIFIENYVYDDVGNLLSKDLNNTETEYTYDDADQLLTETRGTWSATYTYDDNGNRLSKAVGGTTEVYEYDDADKLLNVKVGGSAIKTYGYDSAGRTTSVVTGSGTTTLAYDYESRVTGITYPNSSTNSFTYNGLDTRVSKVDSAGTSTYRRDGAYVTDPVLSDGSLTHTPGISTRSGSTTTYQHSDPGAPGQHPPDGLQRSDHEPTAHRRLRHGDVPKRHPQSQRSGDPEPKGV
jgi:YD repeat-containing protein